MSVPDRLPDIPKPESMGILARGVVFDSLAPTVGMGLYWVLSGERHPSAVAAGICAALVFVLVERDTWPRSLGMVKSGLAAFNTWAVLEMIATFRSAPMATGELMMLLGINYLLLSRLAPRGEGAPAP